MEEKVSNESHSSKFNFWKCCTKKKDTSSRIDDEDIEVEAQRISETSKKEKAKWRIFIVGVLFLAFIVISFLLAHDDGQRRIQLTQKGHAKDDNNRLCWYFGNGHFDYEASWWNERENHGKLLSDLEQCNIEAEIVKESMRRKNPDCLFWTELVKNETCFIHSKCKLVAEGVVFGNDIGAKSCPLEEMMAYHETTKGKIREDCNMPEYMKPFHCNGKINYVGHSNS